MAVKVASRGPIQLRREYSDDEDEVASTATTEPEDALDDGASDAESTSSSENGNNRNSSADEDEDADSDEGEDEDEDGSDKSSAHETDIIKDVSFGTLAEAQERFAPQSRKRRLPGSFDGEEVGRKRTDTKESKDRTWSNPAPKQSRQSKHAPTILSSRQQVSRKREIFEPSQAVKSRDPRFDPTIMSSTYDKNAVGKANKNYAFLTSYQASEILDLKAQIKKAGKDPDRQAELKRQVMSIEAKIRNAETRQREDKIVKEHNQKEKEAIRAGHKAKPYYLKPSEIKKQAQEERLAGMGKRARDKSEKRKKKREKSKDAKNMPRFRRE